MDKDKKIIIGLFVSFSLIILIIGGTFAFFTASKSENNIDLLTADIRNTILIDDDTENMRQGLVPTSLENLEIAYNKQDNKCIDDNERAACSIYRFTVTNTAQVGQNLIIKMAPLANSFKNLYYKVYEINGDNSDEVQGSTKLNYQDITTEYSLVESLNLLSSGAKTYEIVFYVYDTGEDQTSDDSGKQFGASVKIQNVATGQYIAKNFGEGCWDFEEISEYPGTYRLTKFNGLEVDGTPKEACNGYIEKTGDDYSLFIPSMISNTYKVTTLGETLFIAYDNWDDNGPKYNHYQRIKDIKMQNGITTMENSGYDGTFMGVGTFWNASEDRLEYLYEEGVSLELSNTLDNMADSVFSGIGIKKLIIPEGITKIDYSAFYYGLLEEVTIPSSVVSIGDFAFANSRLKKVIFVVDANERSGLTTIGERAFYAGLSYPDEEIPLVIPASVTSIGLDAFGWYGVGGNLKYIRYLGTTDLGDNWYNKNVVNLYAPNVVRNGG